MEFSNSAKDFSLEARNSVAPSTSLLYSVCGLQFKMSFFNGAQTLLDKDPYHRGFTSILLYTRTQSVGFLWTSDQPDAEIST